MLAVRRHEEKLLLGRGDDGSMCFQTTRAKVRRGAAQ